MISKDTIGSSVMIDFPELGATGIPARVDTGARTSTIWASNISEKGDTLQFELFDQSSPHHQKSVIKVKNFDRRKVTSSNGFTEERYMVKLLVSIGNRKIRAMFTLADRSTQSYPILIGRNILRGKFIVDIKHSKPLITIKKPQTTGETV